jgi:hypothetical protein
VNPLVKHAPFWIWTIVCIGIGYSVGQRPNLPGMRETLEDRCQAVPEVSAEIAEKLRGTTEEPLSAETLRQVLADVVHHC